MYNRYIYICLAALAQKWLQDIDGADGSAELSMAAFVQFTTELSSGFNLDAVRGADLHRPAQL